MAFETLNTFTLVLRDTVETVSTYELDDLTAQRAAVQARRDAETKRSEAEMARLDGLIAQCTTLGVVSRIKAAQDVAVAPPAVEVAPAVIETPPLGNPSV